MTLLNTTKGREEGTKVFMFNTKYIAAKRTRAMKKKLLVSKQCLFHYTEFTNQQQSVDQLLRNTALTKCTKKQELL
jgi:hypothetical protein